MSYDRGWAQSIKVEYCLSRCIKIKYNSARFTEPKIGFIFGTVGLFRKKTFSYSSRPARADNYYGADYL